ncbi:MAG: hypothetical protein HY093_03275 [Candidatus Liptonbacteria bacterium]|nr:hypothetical protein [Candidatus Liptonbacteria bacterium]
MTALNVIKDFVVKEETCIESEEVIAEMHCFSVFGLFGSHCVLEARRQKPMRSYRFLGASHDRKITLTHGLLTQLLGVVHEGHKLGIQVWMPDGSDRWVTWQRRV